MNRTTHKHKRYDETFKRSAVEHWLLSGQSANGVAEELAVFRSIRGMCQREAGDLQGAAEGFAAAAR